MSYVRILLPALALASWLPAQVGPSHVIVTYRVYPDKRAAFRNSLPFHINRLTHWKDQGSLAGFQVLAPSLIDDEGWDSLVLAKTGTRGLELFRRFDPPDNSGVYNTTTIPADLVDRGGDADEAPYAGIYLVIPYDCRGSADVQKELLRPVLNDSVKEGSLLGFRFFEPRFPAGRSWNGLLVLHYVDWIAFGKTGFKAPLNEACQEKVHVIAETVGAK